MQHNDAPDKPASGGGFVVRIQDKCEARLTGGYAGCECAVRIGSLALARTLAGALLERTGADLGEGRFSRALAGGTRTITLEGTP